jgi:hypothetical protein
VASQENVPVSLVAGEENDLLLISPGELGRFVVPFAPTVSSMPTIAGEAVEGHVLSASPGAWSHEPSSYTYQWQSCVDPGGTCVNLPGEVAATHSAAPADVGHSLRVVVTASNIGGTASAASEVSPRVGVAPVPKPQIVTEVAPLVPVSPVVGASMTWTFRWSHRYTTIRSLLLHNLPIGGSVEVVCKGSGCPFRRHVWATAASQRPCRGHRCKRSAVLRSGADIARVFKGRHLGIGGRVVVTVTKAGWVGKTFEFKIRADRTPSVNITCQASKNTSISASGRC